MRCQLSAGAGWEKRGKFLKGKEGAQERKIAMYTKTTCYGVFSSFGDDIFELLFFTLLQIHLCVCVFFPVANKIEQRKKNLECRVEFHKKAQKNGKLSQVLLQVSWALESSKERWRHSEWPGLNYNFGPFKGGPRTGHDKFYGDCHVKVS